MHRQRPAKCNGGGGISGGGIASHELVTVPLKTNV
jgi:hypothetical protein